MDDRTQDLIRRVRRAYRQQARLQAVRYFTVPNIPEEQARLVQILYDTLALCMAHLGSHVIEAWLRNLDTQRMDSLLLVGALRYTFAQYRGTWAWRQARDRAQATLTARGEDVSTLMSGLLPSKEETP